MSLGYLSLFRYKLVENIAIFSASAPRKNRKSSKITQVKRTGNFFHLGYFTKPSTPIDLDNRHRSTCRRTSVLNLWKSSNLVNHPFLKLTFRQTSELLKMSTVPRLSVRCPR